MITEQILEQQMDFVLEFGVEPTRVSMNRDTRDELMPEIYFQLFGMEVYIDNSLPYGVTAVSDEQPLNRTVSTR